MNYKKVLLFILIFIITYWILFSPSFGFPKVYRDFIQSLGTTLFHHLGDKGIVYVKPEPKDVSMLKLFITTTDLKVDKGYRGTEYGYSLNTYGLFLPAILFLSLMMATLLSWK